MAFAADMHVFPGGAVDPGDTAPGLAGHSTLTGADASRRLGGDLAPNLALAAHVAAIRELFEEAGVLLADGVTDAAAMRSARHALLTGTSSILDVARDLELRLRPDLLVPLSHWTTPPILPRRFDTRFFAAELPPGAEVSFETDEVVAHRWMTPRAALDAMAVGEMTMWLPTSTTLQQLEHVSSFFEITRRLTPGTLGPPRVQHEAREIIRISASGAGGVPGQTINTYVVGDRELVVVDPGDPSEAAADAVFGAARERGGKIVAIALTHTDPDHAAGAEALALRLGVPTFGGIGANRRLPFPIGELGDGDPVGSGDVPLRALATPGPSPDHVVYRVGAGATVICGDLVGPRAERAILRPPDGGAWSESLDRLRQLGATRLLPGHGDPLGVAALSGGVTPPGSGGS
jgi:glyoxylase-like metal-dependent hydrolase (beta-lactamase superfamily II)/8-oxo-dGTP pyrophosphatase MutT (NUDIX family)